MATEKLQSFYGGVMSGIKPDMLPPFASPFGANAVIDQIAEEQGKVRRRKGTTTKSYTPLTGEPEVLGIFSYPATEGNKILIVASDGSINVEGDNEVLPPFPEYPPVISHATCEDGVAGVAVAYDSYAYDPNPRDSIASYDWDFGDGSPHGSAASGTHTYAAANTYTVVLTVTDNDGQTSTATLTVVIEAA